MTVRIRLSRMGKKGAPFYRIVAIDQRARRDGQFLENIGTYNAITGEIVQFHPEKMQAWVGKGAVPSDTVARIQKQFVRAQKVSQGKVAAPVAAKKNEKAKVTKKEVASEEVVATENSAK